MSHNRPEFYETVLLQGGRVLDPGRRFDEKADILIEGLRIKKIGSVDAGTVKGRVLDCSGKIVVPGLMDMHVHLREPGEEHKEDMESGGRAAMNGGFTAVCCMPNTKPVIDSRSHVEFLKKRSSGFLVDIHPVGAVTKNSEGNELTEMHDMMQAGAVAFSDDGHPVESSAIMRRAMEYAGMLGCVVIDHCQDLSLSAGAVMNESLQSTYAGLKSMPSVSESIQVSRDVLLAEFTGFPVHIAHVSTEESVRIIRNAKARNVPVTAETCPHYLVLTDEAVRSYDTNLKMYPPLRGEKDRTALIEGLKDGTIDVIATDHAPHHRDDKDLEFDAAAFGVTGLETAVGIILTKLVHEGELTLSQLVEKMSTNPRRIVNVPVLSLTEGEDANISVIDPEQEWTVKSGEFLSKSMNSPFIGWKCRGGPFAVINNQQIFVKDLE